jgi:hypothetical protein
MPIKVEKPSLIQASGSKSKVFEKFSRDFGASIKLLLSFENKRVES